MRRYLQARGVVLRVTCSWKIFLNIYPSGAALRNKRLMNIVFIGMSGSGKSIFAKYCADLLNMPIIDLDSEICRKYGGSIPAIFAAGGEKLFRELELNEAIEAANASGAIIATGGGTVTQKDAMLALKKSGLVVHLNCDLQTLTDRLGGANDERPLLETASLAETLQKMLDERERLYYEYADVVLNETDVLKSRNIENAPLGDQLGALYLELVLKLEKKVYAKFK